MQISRRAFLGSIFALGFGHPAVVDSHLHFWDPARLDYPWLKGSPLGAAHLPADYFRATAGRVGKVIFVQAECRHDQALAEVDWVTSLAACDRRISAIVAFAPAGDPPRLASLLAQLRRRPLVRGIRCLTQDEGDPQACLRAPFAAGVKQIAEAGLIFEAGVNAPQLRALAQLAARLPHARLVLDHLGNPPIAEGKFAAWAADLRAVAAQPNVHCKISGVMERAGKNWSRAQLQPWIDHALDCFGARRVFWGSNWPVCDLAGGTLEWLEAAEALTRRRGRAFQRRLFSANARAFFKV